MFLLLIVMVVFVGLWLHGRARNRQLAFERTMSVTQPTSSYVPRPMGIPAPPSYSEPLPPVHTHSYAEDVAIGVGVAAVGATVYELLSHERDEDTSSSSSNDDYQSSSDDNSNDGGDSFGGGDSDGGGSSGDY